jgi:superoxide reductase
MTKKGQVYKCEICGNIVQILHEGAGELVCCGAPMILMPEQTADLSKEKHVPVVEQTDKGITVIVGSTPHPMEEKHWIEWIEVITTCGKTCRAYLQPGQAPEAFFNVEMKYVQAVREYCNIHGLWVNNP